LKNALIPFLPSFFREGGECLNVFFEVDLEGLEGAYSPSPFRRQGEASFSLNDAAASEEIMALLSFFFPGVFLLPWKGSFLLFSSGGDDSGRPNKKKIFLSPPSFSIVVEAEKSCSF